jgi:hypothetical protein
MALIDGELVELHSASLVLRNTSAALVANAQLALRRRKALVDGELVQLHSASLILRNTSAILVAKAQIILRRCKALVDGELGYSCTARASSFATPVPFT